MKTSTVTALVLAAATLAGGEQASAKAAIEAAYRRADAEFVEARTIAALDAIREWLDTPDCVYTDFGRPARRWPEMRAYAAEGLRTRIKTLRSQIDRLDVDGDTAVATTVVTGVAHVVDDDGQFGVKGRAHDVETTATVRDAWIRMADGWRRTSHTKTVANHVTAVDGQRVASPR